MRAHLSLTASVVCWAGLAACAAAGEFEVPLSVEEAAGVDRPGAVASGGIPLPEGRFKTDQPFAVYAGGAELPAQVLPLVVSERGFLRWVLVDVQVDLKAKERKELVLRAAAPAAKPAAALKVTDDAAGVTVDTGKIRFTVARDKPFGLFASVEAGGKPVVSGGEVSYTDGFDGKKYPADKPAGVAVEYSGPVRVTVCAKGRFAGDEQTKAQYIARVTAWAGRSDVQVKYSIANSNPDHYCYRALKESAIALKLAAAATGTVLGAAKPLEAGAAGWLASGLRPGAAASAKAGDGEKETWVSAGKGEVADGYLAEIVGFRKCCQILGE